MEFNQIHTYEGLTYKTVFALKKRYLKALSYRLTIRNSALYVKEILAIEDEARRLFIPDHGY